MINFKEPPDLSPDQLLQIAAHDTPRKSSLCKFCKKADLQWLTYAINGTSKWVLVELDDEGLLRRHQCAQASNSYAKSLSISFKKAFPSSNELSSLLAGVEDSGHSLDDLLNVEIEKAIKQSIKESIEGSIANKASSGGSKFLGKFSDFTFNPNINYPPVVPSDDTEGWKPDED